MEKRPVLKLHQLNPRLFDFIEELNVVKVCSYCQLHRHLMNIFMCAVVCVGQIAVINLFSSGGYL
jgi:hypothetical protein